MDTLKMHVLVLCEDGIWVAQALEHDIAAQGSSTKEAINALGMMILAEVRYDKIAGREPLSRIGRAPLKFWNLFGRSERVRLDRQQRAVDMADGETGSVVNLALAESEFAFA